MPRFRDAVINDLTKLLREAETNQATLVSDVGAELVLLLRVVIENTLFSIGSFDHLAADAKARFSSDGTSQNYRAKAAEHLKKIKPTTTFCGWFWCQPTSPFDKLFYAARALFDEAATVQTINPAYHQQLPAIAFRSDASGGSSSATALDGYQAQAASTL
jgi:hypothetical protein